MDKYILLCIIPVDESISGLNIKPLNSAGHFGGYDLLLDLLLFDVTPSLWLLWLGLRVSHDGMVVWMLDQLYPTSVCKMAFNLVKL